MNIGWLLRKIYCFDSNETSSLLSNHIVVLIITSGLFFVSLTRRLIVVLYGLPLRPVINYIGTMAIQQTYHLQHSGQLPTEPYITHRRLIVMCFDCREQILGSREVQRGQNDLGSCPFRPWSVCSTGPSDVSSTANNVTYLNPFFGIKLDVKSNKKELNNNIHAICTHTQPMIRPLNGRIRSPDGIAAGDDCNWIKVAAGDPAIQ